MAYEYLDLPIAAYDVLLFALENTEYVVARLDGNTQDEKLAQNILYDRIEEVAGEAIRSLVQHRLSSFCFPLPFFFLSFSRRRQSRQLGSLPHGSNS